MALSYRYLLALIDHQKRIPRCSRAAPGDSTVLLHGYDIAVTLTMCQSTGLACMDIGDWFFELS